MTRTTPHEVRNGRQIARKPKMMSTIAHTIDFPEPRLDSPAGAMFEFLLALGIAAYSTGSSTCVPVIRQALAKHISSRHKAASSLDCHRRFLNAGICRRFQHRGG